MFLQPKFEAVLSEIDIVTNDLRYVLYNLESWMQPSYVAKNLVSNVQVICQNYRITHVVKCCHMTKLDKFQLLLRIIKCMRRL